MERLPMETLESIIGIQKTTLEAFEKHGSEDSDYCPAYDKAVLMLLEELKQYRIAEEQGLLYRKIFYIGDYCHQPGDCPLNCEYCSDNYLEVKDSVVEINRNHIYGEIGKTVFLTKGEAEQALARMENG